MFENSADKLIISFPRTFNLADSTNIDVISKIDNVDVGENVQGNNVYIGDGSSQISKINVLQIDELVLPNVPGRHGPVKLYLSADTDIFNAVEVIHSGLYIDIPSLLISDSILATTFLKSFGNTKYTFKLRSSGWIPESIIDATIDRVSILLAPSKLSF